MTAIRASVNDGEHSAVQLAFTGYGKVNFYLDKMYSHCGATVLHNVSFHNNAGVKSKAIKEIAYDFTSWLLKPHTDRSRNFRRSRIIATDHLGGWIDIIARNDDRWKISNGINNVQTDRNVYIYWLDRNK